MNFKDYENMVDLEEEFFMEDDECSESYWLDQLKQYYGSDFNIEDEYDDFTQYLYNR